MNIVYSYLTHHVYNRNSKLDIFTGLKMSPYLFCLTFVTDKDSLQLPKIPLRVLFFIQKTNKCKLLLNMIQNLPTLCKAIKTRIETQPHTCSYPDRTSHNSRLLRNYIGFPVKAPRVTFKMAALRMTTFTVYSVCARLARVSSRLLSYEQNGQDKTSTQPLTEGEETNTVLSQANNSHNG